MTKRLEELAALLPGARIVGDAQTEITSIERDSRRAREGTLFACIVGAHVDAHSFIPDVARAGARAVLTERSSVDVPAGVAVLYVPNLEKALDTIVPFFYDYPARAMRVVGITGTNGKTTTTTLLGELLRAHFPVVGVGGNIGVPLIDVVQETPAEGAIAAEISSYQMEATTHFHAHIVAELNITPDHIVRHGSMEVYQAMKEKLFAAQTAEDYLVLNADDPHTRGMAERAAGRVCLFSRREELTEGACVRADGMIVIRWDGAEHVLIPADELGIPGAHNVENVLAASAMALFAGVTPAEMRPVLRAFKGVEHRIEFVRALAGVSYYNDSKATNTDSAIKALEAFDGHIILIAGGDDKLTDLGEFMELVHARVDELILVGDAAERFAAAARDAGIPEAQIHRVGYHMEKAVQLARELAVEGQIVLLSPACASFDMYGGYEERGRDFKRLVNEL